MYRIRRVLLSRVGYQEAWYDGMVIPFTNAENSEPDHTIINLENGGGKTTLLSLIASCFVPEQRKFIQHLQKPHHHFRDYFDRVPGVIAIELDASNADLVESDRRLVIAQCVVVRENQELDRDFCLFDAQPGFGFDELPFAGLGNEFTVDTREQLKNWLKRAPAENASFQHTDTQSDWQKLLDSNGVDPWLVEKQVDLCKTEAGLDVFSKFESEDRFMHAFFDMVLDSDSGAAVCDALGQTIEKSRQYPEQKRRSELLHDFVSRLETFGESAGEYVTAEGKLRQAEAHVLGMAAAIEARIETEASKKVRAEVDLETINQQLLDAQQATKQAQVHYETLEDLRLSRLVSENEDLVAEIARKVEALRGELSCIKAADYLTALRAKEAEVRSKRELLESKSAELAPVRERVRAAGSALRARLQVDVDAEQARIDDLTEQVERLDEQDAQLKTDQKRLEGEQAEALKEQTLYQERLDQYERALNRLRESGILAEDEAPKTALERNEERLADNEEQRERAQQEQAQLQQRRREQQQQRESVQARLSQHRADAKQVRDQLTEGETERDRIAGDDELKRLLGTDDIDPALDWVYERLSELAEKRDSQRRRLDNDINALQRDVERIRETGLAPGDADTDKALAFLHERGLEQARDYPGYLADGVTSGAEETRRLVNSDPARYLGVVVYRDEDLARLRETDFADLKLSKPVVVSKPSTDAADADEGRHVIPAAHDAVYDRNAAAELLSEADEQLTDLQQQQARVKQESEVINGLRETIRDYRRRFGGDRLESLRHKLAELDEGIARADEELDAINTASEDLERQEATLKSRLEGLRGDAQELQKVIHELRTFLRDHADAHAENRRLLAEARDRLTRVGEQLAEARQGVERNASLRESLNDQRRDAETARFNLRQRFGAVDYHLADESGQSAPDASLEELQSSYDTLLQTLHESEDKLDLEGLQNQLKVARERANEARRTYEHHLGGQREADVAAFVGKNLDAETQQRQTELERALEEKGAAESAVTTARNQLVSFRSERHHKQEKANIPNDVAELPLEELGAVSRRAESEAREARERRDAISQDREQQRRAVERIDAGISDLQQARKVLPHVDSEVTMESMDLSTESIEAIGAQADAAKEYHTGATGQLKQAGEIAGKAYRPVHEFLSSPEFEQHEPRICRSMAEAGTHIASACHNASRFLDAARTRQRAVNEILERLKGHVDVVINRLMNFANEAIVLLDRACRSRVPDGVPYFGGKPIIKVRQQLKRVEYSERQQAVDGYIRELIEAGVTRTDPAKLATELLQKYAEVHRGDRELGIQLLKPADANPHYVPITRHVGSGGQGMTSAMLLYLVMADIRAQMRALSMGGGKAYGFLLVDNPFAKVNSPSLLLPQVEMATQLGVQLIFPTGIQDYNSLRTLPHVVRLRKAGKDRNTGRIVLEVADWTFHRGSAATEEAQQVAHGG